MSASSTVAPVRTAPWLRRRAVATRAPAPDVRRLRDNATAAFEPGRGGLALRCSAGTVVVTQAGDPADHVLLAGDAFRTARRGRVVAWALSDATLEVTSCDGPEPAREIARAA